jgi:hypothetical protein
VLRAAFWRANVGLPDKGNLGRKMDCEIILDISARVALMFGDNLMPVLSIM